MSDTRLTERERRDYDALPSDASKKAYCNIRESSIGHAVAIGVARDMALADALVLAAADYADSKPGAEDDIVMAEHDILIRLDVDLDETEQGLTQKASDAVYGFATRHTSKSVLAARVFGPPEPKSGQRIVMSGDQKITFEWTRDEANSIAGALDTLAGLDEGEHTDYDELIRLRDGILATPGVH